MVSIDRRREQLIAAAKAEHDQVCRCDPKYLMSCGRMAAEILKLGPATVWHDDDTRCPDPLEVTVYGDAKRSYVCGCVPVGW